MSGQDGWREDSGALHPKTGVLRAAPRHSLSSVTAGRVEKETSEIILRDLRNGTKQSEH